MERVTVAELKSRLSHYLREVRAGKSFTVVSRDIPVATLGPHVAADADDLLAIPADPAGPPLSAPVLGRPSRLPDAAELLRRDRDDRDARLLEIARETIEARRRRHEGGGREP
jgi:prevent-host-death family protein